MKEKFASFLWGSVKFAVAGVLTWLIPALLFVWNGKDNTRTFILDAVEPEFKRIEAKQLADIQLIDTKITLMSGDVTIIKECMLSGCNRK